jgi:hypothetical protein
VDDRFADYRWLAAIDERILWATLAAAVVLLMWGAFVGWRKRDETSDQSRP